jgi:hypothetical protein
MAINKQEALSAAGVDLSRGRRDGKYLCPSCDEYGVSNKPNSKFCKCWAHGGCGWKFPTKDRSSARHPISEAMNHLRDYLQHYLREQKDCHLRNNVVKYFTETRKVDVRVLFACNVGVVGPNIDPKLFIQTATEEIAKIEDKERRELTMADMEVSFAEPLRMHLKSKEGWMVFFYEDCNGDIVAANFRRIEKKADDNGRMKNVCRMFNPLGYRGLFNDWSGSGLVLSNKENHFVLVVEGEVNSLQLLSAYARQYGGDWVNHALAHVAVGASAGVDQKTLWMVLKDNDCLPIVCEDNDAGAGEKVTRTIANGGFTRSFKLPVKDLDDFLKARISDEAQALGELVKMISKAPIFARPWGDVIADLDYIRSNPKLLENGVDDEGKPKALPKHLLNRKIYDFVEHDLETRAKMFVSVHPYVYLTEEHELVRFQKDSNAATELMKRYGLLATEDHTKLVTNNLESYIYEKHGAMEVHKFGALQQLPAENHACYVNKGDGQMFRITATEIETVANGFEGIYVLEEGLFVWDDLTDDDRAYMEKLGQQIGENGAKVSDTPLCNHFRSLYEKQRLMPEQCEQLELIRLLFHWVANVVSLWPMTIHLGEQNSGKSTGFEKFQKLMYGFDSVGSNLPSKRRDLLAGMTNNASTLYDNIDSADFGRKQSDFLDVFCGACTGMFVSLAELYKTNRELKFNLRNHLKLTCRTSPFDRGDAMRRVLEFTIRKPTQKEWKSKDVTMDALWTDEPIIKLEILVRLQRIVRAFDKCGDREYLPLTEMPEFEMFTYKLADYEGWLPEMQEIWKAYVQQYSDSITDSNPMAFLAKLWLGESKRPLRDANHERELSVSELWTEFITISERLHIKTTYTSPSSFGKHILKNISSLKVLGYSDNGYSGGQKRLRFRPDAKTLEECKKLYLDIEERTCGRHDTPADLDDVS